MVGDRSRYGLLVAALGAGVLAISLYLPWYSEAVTRVGSRAAAALARHGGQQALGTVRADTVLGGLFLVLLVLAGLALLDALVPLLRSGRLPDGAGASLALLGMIAGACVLFRIVDPPASASSTLSLAPREGAWLALAASAAVLAGGVWPRARASSAVGEGQPETPWLDVSGVTP